MDDGVEFLYISSAMEEGYPGTLKTRVRYSVVFNKFKTTYLAKTDSPTILNLTNHTYFNLDGHNQVRNNSKNKKTISILNDLSYVFRR